MAEEKTTAPFYGDLSKKTNDVFGKAYHFGLYKLDLKTKSEGGVEFNSGIVSNHESGKVAGTLSSQYTLKEAGVSFTEKWNTDNTLATEISLTDKVMAGLKLTLAGTFAPQSGVKTGVLKTAFKNETVALNTSIDLDMAGPLVDVAAVVANGGFIAGFNSAFDTQKAKFNKNNFTVGYHTPKFVLNTNVDNGNVFGGAIYQKLNDNLECGVSMKWSSGSTDTLFGVGMSYKLDDNASLHCKVNNKALIGVGYIQTLRPGITMTMSAAIDGHNFNGGGHKVGLALTVQP